MKKTLRYYIQKFGSRFFEYPIIPEGKTVGFSLVRSEKYKVRQSSKSRITAPYYIHNVELGDYSYIAKNCTIKNTKIGKFCSIGPNLSAGLGVHPTNGISTSPMFYSRAKQNGFSLSPKNKIEEHQKITIGNDVFIGANVTILDGVTIGNGAVIGAGAVVVNDIPPYAIAVGVPAKVVKYRFEPDTIAKLEKLEWWDFDEEKLQLIEEKFFDVEGLLESEGF